MPKRLIDLTIKEGSFCAMGLNPQAKVILFKVADRVPSEPLTVAKLEPVLGGQAVSFLAKMEEAARTFDEIEDNRAVRERIQEKTWTLQQSINSILDDSDADQMTMLQQSVAEFSAAILAELPNLVTKAGRKISAKRMQQLRAALTALQAVLAEQEEKSMAKKEPNALDLTGLVKALPEEIREAAEILLKELEAAKAESEENLKKAAADLKAAQAKIADLEKEEPSEEDLLKAVPEPIRKRLEAAEAKATEAEEVAKAERNARQLQEFLKQAETELPNLPVAAAEVGRLLKAMSEQLEKADFEQVLTLLKAGSEALFQVLKISGDDPKPDGNSAIAKIEALAAEMRKAEPALTEQQAFAKAVEASPTLYGEYLSERRLSA